MLEEARSQGGTSPAVSGVAKRAPAESPRGVWSQPGHCRCSLGEVRPPLHVPSFPSLLGPPAPQSCPRSVSPHPGPGEPGSWCITATVSPAGILGDTHGQAPLCTAVRELLPKHKTLPAPNPPMLPGLECREAGGTSPASMGRHIGVYRLSLRDTKELKDCHCGQLAFCALTAPLWLSSAVRRAGPSQPGGNDFCPGAR